MRKRYKLLIGAMILIVAGAAFYYFERAAINHWIQRNAISRLVDQLRPHLPFKIERFRYSSRRSNILAGNLADLRITILWKGYRVHLEGPLSIRSLTLGSLLTVTYEPTFEIEPENNDKARSQRLPLVIRVDTNSSLTGLSSLKIDVPKATWKWKYFDLEIKDLEALIEAQGTEWAFELSAQDSSADLKGRLVQAGGIELGAHGTWQSKPFELGAGIQASARVKSFETAQGESYLGMDLLNYPLSLDLDLEKDLSSWKSARVRVGKGIEANFTRKGGGLDADWKVSQIDFKDLFTNVLPALGVSALKEMKVRKGLVLWTGTASVPELSGRIEKATVRSRLQLKNQTWVHPAWEMGLGDWSLDLPLVWERGAVQSSQGYFEIGKGVFKRMLFSLKRTSFRIESDSEYLLNFETEGSLPIQFEVGVIQPGAISIGIAREDRLLSLDTSLRVTNLDLPTLASAMCVRDPSLVPPAKIQVIYPRISMDPDSVILDGRFQVDLFGGHLYVVKTRGFRLGTPVPEYQFSASWKEISLGKIGEWLGMGKMYGLIEGHARNVVIQDWLPTQYEFLARAKKDEAGDLELSSEAVRNITEMIAGGNVESQLPGVARFLLNAFPGIFLPDFSVQYAGLSLYSKEGVILLETMDPPEQVRSSDTRYILKGPRFKIELKSTEYPVLIDAYAMSNQTRIMVNYLKGLRTKTGEGEENDECFKADIF